MVRGGPNINTTAYCNATSKALRRGPTLAHAGGKRSGQPRSQTHATTTQHIAPYGYLHWLRYYVTNEQAPSIGIHLFTKGYLTYEEVINTIRLLLIILGLLV